MIARMCGVQLIVNVHGIVLNEVEIYLENFDVDQKSKLLIKNIFKSFVKSTLAYVDKKIYVSKTHVALTNAKIDTPLSRFDPEKEFVIHNPIFEEKLLDISEVETKLRTDHEDIIIGQVGNISPIKNNLRFLEIALHLTEVAQHVGLKKKLTFVIAGPVNDEEYYQECARFLEKHPELHVIFLGSVDAREVYKKLDIFIITSLSEGIPLSMMEALGNGVKVYSPDIGGIKEIMEIVFGESGYIYEQHVEISKDILIEKNLLLRNVLEKLDIETVKRVRERFSEYATYAQYLELLD